MEENCNLPDEPEDAKDIPPVGTPASWDYEADIVCVGGGGSGLCAAAKALENGAKVIVLEKQSETGGHSQHAGAAATFNTKEAIRKRLKTDRSKAFKHAYTVQSNSSIDTKLLATLIDRAHEVYDWSETQSWGKRWVALSLGFSPDQGVARIVVKGSLPNIPFTSGTEQVAMMYPWLKWLAKHVSEKGGKILVNTKAMALVKEGDRITGVKAETTDGRILYVKANRAVILAGAGFTNNRAMIKKYCPDVHKKAVATFLPPHDTGEAARMAFGAGADLAGTDTWLGFPGGIPFYDTNYTGKPEPGPWFQYLRHGWIQLACGRGWLEVNAACEEYIPDTAHLLGELHAKAIANQPGAAVYVIFDADYQENLWDTMPPPIMGNRPMTQDDNEYPWFDKFKHLMPKNWLDSVNQAIEYGGIKYADTIEELAKKLGLDPISLSDRVKAWNAKASSGKQDKFGRIPQNTKPIVKPPFYGIKTGNLLATLYCGPRVNYKFQVLDKKLKPIPGLYAAGLTAGGTAGESVMAPSILSGVGLAFSTGWIAGDNASADKPSYEPSEMIVVPDMLPLRILTKISLNFPKIGAYIIKTINKRSRPKKHSKQYLSVNS